jgi:beta-galactosidase
LLVTRIALALLWLGSAAALLFAAPLRVHAAPRDRERFDRDWRFYRGDISGAENETFDDAKWRVVDLPHDWSIEDLPPLDTPSTPALAVTAGEWRFQPGDDPAWKSPQYDDSTWRSVQLPAHWSAINYKAENSYAWYRRRITVPPALRGKDVILLIGKVDDVDETFVNGVKVGGMGTFPPNYSTAWEISRRYLVPARLLKGDGTDVVAVRDYNGQADAGIYEAATAPHRSGPFDAESEGGTAQGYTVGGIGWYRKSFTLPARMHGRQLDIAFDGVYMNSQVWFNGHRLGEQPYGYTGFHFDLTPYARYGSEHNVLVVKVDASGRTSRWYSGAGIYRHVWLTATDPVHIAHNGIAITTPQVAAAQATVRIRTRVDNADSRRHLVRVTARLLDPHGATVATATAQRSVDGAGTGEFDQTLTVARPELWSPDTPTRYRLVSEVAADARAADALETSFGIRAIAFDAVHGFTLNGKSIKLRGGCVHHDNGCLGSATYDRAEERRVAILKASGYNAIRTSHNPPSPAFLDACDRLGVLVMDEAFDCWRYGKNGQDYGRFFDTWWQRDIDAMVLRDRNHPCVVLWSIGNEIPEQTSAEGATTGAMLAKYVRSLDPTRPVAQATNPDGDKLDPLLANLDVTGYNYAESRFGSDHVKHPERVFAATESFPQSCFESWMAVLDHPYAIGDFVWTAMDYLGEAGLGKTVPQSTPPGASDNRLWTVSNCGDIDLLGNKRPQSYYRNVVWGVGPILAAFVQALGPDGQPERVEGWGWTDERPSWTWPGLEGKTLTVRAYANCAQARLLLNGKDLGAKPTNRSTRFTASWDVRYEPGELVAVGLDAAGKEVARWPLRTAGKATTIRLTPDRAVITADGEDLSYVAVDLVDDGGLLDPNANTTVHFSLAGPGKMLAVANADPRSEESFQQPQRKAWRGRCLVVIQSTEKGGAIHLTASGSGLKDAETVITSRIVGRTFPKKM